MHMIYSFIESNLNNYPCPLCVRGKLYTMPLMEAIACEFCQHIFTVNLEQKVLQMADSQIALTWHWTGKKWKGVSKNKPALTWKIGLIAIIFLTFPTSLVGLSAYIFPPLANSALQWFPWFWMGLTFCTHLGCLLWLILEYYQVPVFLYLRGTIR